MALRRAKPLSPHPKSDRLKRALEKCLAHLAAWSGLMFRATGIEYANRADLLSGAGSKLYGARWTPRGAFPAAYGSLDPQTALLEALGTGDRYGVPYEKRMPLVMVAVNVNLERLLDLTLPVVRRALRVSFKAMLEEDWEGHQQRGTEALTQAVARLARELGIQALLVPSARLKGKRNLVIFPDKLPSGSLKIHNVEKLPERQAGLGGNS
jgi:RES domain-containing protein